MAGSFISAIGNWFSSVAVGWLVWEIGRSDLLLGAANFAQMGPMLVLGLVGGVIADRVERRRLLLGTQFIVISASLLLAVFAVLNSLTIPVMMILLLMLGVSQSFAWPAWSPLIADLVGPERLRLAIALNSARFNLTRIIGPAIAGVLLAQMGAGPLLFTAAACQLMLIVTMLVIHPRQQLQKVKESIPRAMMSGIRVVVDVPSVRETMAVALVIGILLMPYMVFLPAFSESALQMGPEGYGLLLTAVGVGAIVGAVVSGMRVVAADPRLSQAVLAAVTGVSLAVFALSTWLPLSLFALIFVGLGSIGYLATANATVQLAVPRSMIGRVMGLWVVVTAGSTPLGGIILGALAESFGRGPTLAVAGIVSFVFVVVVYFLGSGRQATAE